MEHPEMKKPRARFSRRLVLWLTLAAVALTAALVALLPTIQARLPGPNAAVIDTTPSHRTLYESGEETPSEIEISHRDGERYTLLCREDALYLEGENGENTRINESYSSEILAAAASLGVEDVVCEDESELGSALADMGFDPPLLTAEVRYPDGRSVTVELGDSVPDTGYSYCRWSGDPGVYMCDSTLYDAFGMSANMLLAVEQPFFLSSLVERLTLTPLEGAPLDMTFAENGAGTLRAPYAYPMDAGTASSLLSAVQNFRLGVKLEAVTEENQAMYGFDAPSAVVEIYQRAGVESKIDADGTLRTYQTEPSVTTVTIGSPDGEYFYYCEYGDTCYRVSGFLCAAFLAATADSVVSRAPADMGGEELTAITVQAGGGVMDMRVTRTERVLENNQLETDEYGNVIYDVSVTVNGEPSTQETYDALVDRLARMTVSGDRPAGELTGTPNWQITLTTVSGETRVIAGYPMDAFSDAIAVGGVAKHYINGDALQIALGELYPG